MMLGPIGRSLQIIADFQRDCIELATLLPYPYERIKDAVTQVAYGATHPSHLVAGHILRLLKNKWIVEGTSKDFQIQALIEFPCICEQGCLEKFYTLLEESKHE